jgi:hypothetical protein
MSFLASAKPARIIGLVAFAMLLVFGGSRFYDEFRHSHEEGRFVSAVVQEQLASLSRLDDSTVLLRRSAGWPDDFLALQNWLLVTMLNKADPNEAQLTLSELSRNRAVSPVMRASLRRWQESLARWAGSPPQELQSAPALLEEGRKLHHQAIGYARVGRPYDAAPLFLWSATLLARFIEREPESAQVPEALYLLGASTLQFKQVIPGNIRPDRILNLCQEFYPHTVWAERAEELWRREMRHA